jgi:hypothetical protein
MAGSRSLVEADLITSRACVHGRPYLVTLGWR